MDVQMTLGGDLCVACENGDLDRVKILVEQGADVHSVQRDGWHP